jgi:hypothetical protein
LLTLTLHFLWWNHVFVMLCRCSLGHTYILLVHVAIQMQLDITVPYASEYSWIVLQNHLRVPVEVNPPGFIGPMKCLLHLNFVQKQFLISSYSMC